MVSNAGDYTNSKKLLLYTRELRFLEAFNLVGVYLFGEQFEYSHCRMIPSAKLVYILEEAETC